MEASTDISLKELVDYAISMDNEAKAEYTELMCYRLLGDKIRPEDAREIGRIHQYYKEQKDSPKGNTYNAPVGQIIQYADKVENNGQGKEK